MKFFLLCLNVVILLLLGTYLMNLFEIKSYESMTFVYLFVAAVTMVLMANEFIEKFSIGNPLYFVIPGMLAIAFPLIIGKPVATVIASPLIIGKPVTAAIALGWLLLAPGIVLIVRSFIGKKKEGEK